MQELLTGKKRLPGFSERVARQVPSAKDLFGRFHSPDDELSNRSAYQGCHPLGDYPDFEDVRWHVSYKGIEDLVMAR